MQRDLDHEAVPLHARLEFRLTQKLINTSSARQILFIGPTFLLCHTLYEV